MKQKTLQEQYNLIKEGKGNTEVFMKAAKKQFPNIILNAATLDQTINGLKHNHIISENMFGVGMITTGKSNPDWFKIFNENMEMVAEEAKKIVSAKQNGDGSYTVKYSDDTTEKIYVSNDVWDEINDKYGNLTEAKAIEKKPTKDVVDLETKGYDYKDKEKVDNIYGEAFLKGYYTEMKDPKNADKTVDELKEIVAKNLAKDRLYYTKEAQFGETGIGYTEKEMEEVSGKYKESGYSDKLKKSIEESINIVTEAKRAGLSKEETLKVAQKFAAALTKLDGKEYTVSDDYEEDSFALDVDGDEYAGGDYNINADGSVVNMAVWNDKNVSPTYGNVDDDIEIIMNTIKNLNEAETKKMMKKSKKETIDTKLAEIEKAGKASVLEAQIEAIAEIIESKSQRISMVSEDENLSGLVDNKKVKEMQKEIKLLEKRKSKLEKLYEKTCGKSYSKKEMVGEEMAEDAPKEFEAMVDKAEELYDELGTIDAVLKQIPSEYKFDIERHLKGAYGNE